MISELAFGIRHKVLDLTIMNSVDPACSRVHAVIYTRFMVRDVHAGTPPPSFMEAGLGCVGLGAKEALRQAHRPGGLASTATNLYGPVLQPHPLTSSPHRDFLLLPANRSTPPRVFCTYIQPIQTPENKVKDTRLPPPCIESKTSRISSENLVVFFWSSHRSLLYTYAHT